MRYISSAHAYGRSWHFLRSRGFGRDTYLLVREASLNNVVLPDRTMRPSRRRLPLGSGVLAAHRLASNLVSRRKWLRGGKSRGTHIGEDAVGDVFRHLQVPQRWYKRIGEAPTACSHQTPEVDGVDIVCSFYRRVEWKAPRLRDRVIVLWLLKFHRDSARSVFVPDGHRSGP